MINTISPSSPASSTPPKEVASLSPADFQYLSQILKERSGLSLGNEKMYLIESRLLPVARANGLQTLPALVTALRGGSTMLMTQVVNAMATHETFFYRDSRPFEIIKSTLLPELIEKRSKTTRSLRIWCAASSSGQEPYTIAMLLKDFEKELMSWHIEIIGTDMSTPIIERAKKGVYTQFEVQRGLPIQLLVKYFKQVEGEWHIDANLKNMVKFQLHNLLNDPKPLGVFDLVLCRNVLIYFDPPTKAEAFAHIAKVMAPDACLILGAAETVLGISKMFEPVEDLRGIYRRTSL